MAIAMKELKFDESESVIYDLIIELESENKSSITYDDFIDKLIAKLQDRESQRSIERVYELFVEDPDNKIFAPLTSRCIKFFSWIIIKPHNTIYIIVAISISIYVLSIANIKSLILPEAQYSNINQRVFVIREK